MKNNDFLHSVAASKLKPAYNELGALTWLYFIQDSFGFWTTAYNNVLIYKRSENIKFFSSSLQTELLSQSLKGIVRVFWSGVI